MLRDSARSQNLSVGSTSVWVARMQGFPVEIEGIQVCRGRTLLEHSRKLHLEWASVWNEKSKEFFRKKARISGL